MGKNHCRMLWALLVCVVAAGAQAATPGNAPGSYEQIPRRNVFGLKEPPREEKPVDRPPEKPKLVLSGITTVLGNKLALLKQQPLAEGGKAVDPSKEISLMLTEGQRESGVEVLEINEKAGAVKVSNQGQTTMLTFERDGQKPPSTPAEGGGIPPGLAANAPGAGWGRAGMPASVMPPTPGVPYTNANVRPMPMRTPRFPRGSTAAAGSQAIPTPTGPETAIPGAFTPGYTNVSIPNPATGLTAEEERIVQELANQLTAPSPRTQPPAATSGTFQTPPEQGILPAFETPPPINPNPNPPAGPRQP